MISLNHLLLVNCLFEIMYMKHKDIHVENMNFDISEKFPPKPILSPKSRDYPPDPMPRIIDWARGERFFVCINT